MQVERGKNYTGIRQAIFTAPDGSQALLDLWYVDGELDSCSIATRLIVGDVWGPPVEGEWV